MKKNILNALALFRSQNKTATVSIEMDADEKVYVAISNGENLLAEIMMPKSEIGSYEEALELALTLAGYNILGDEEEAPADAKSSEVQDSAGEELVNEPQLTPAVSDDKETEEAPRKRGRRKAKQADDSPVVEANNDGEAVDETPAVTAANETSSTVEENSAVPSIAVKDAKETVVSLNEGAEANPQIKNGILGKKLGSLNKFQLRLIGRDGKDGKAKIFTDETIAAAKALLTQ